MFSFSSSRNADRCAPSRFAAAAQAGFLAALLMAQPLAATHAAAQEAGSQRNAEDAKRYDDCMALASSNPEKALEVAAQWRAIGGGALAKHCGAIAMINVGAEANAARELMELAVTGSGFTVADRASVLTLAGDLWLRQSQPNLALKAYAAARDLAGGTRRMSLGESRAAAMLGDWSAAAAALDPLIELEPSDVEALTLRAAARRSAGDAEGALSDATRATEFSPDIALAWFERGAAERALGQKDAARESWIKASQLDPQNRDGTAGGAAGEMARRNLQLLAAGD